MKGGLGQRLEHALEGLPRLAAEAAPVPRRRVAAPLRVLAERGAGPEVEAGVAQVVPPHRRAHLPQALHGRLGIRSGLPDHASIHGVQLDQMAPEHKPT